VRRIWAGPATVQTETLTSTIVHRREDVSGPHDTEVGKGRDQHFDDRLYDHMGVAASEVQEGADGAFPRAVRARRALGNSLTTR
jgi:hypothetical protein